MGYMHAVTAARVLVEAGERRMRKENEEKGGVKVKDG